MTGFANLSPRDGEIYNEGFEEGRAESEAQIAALKSQLNESEMHRHELMERLQDRVAQIATLQSERDVLKGALSKLVRECFGSMELEPELMRQLWGNTNVNILEQRIAEARALLGISASGEPARKP